MNPLRNLPIKRKVMVITLLVSGVALFLASAAFVTYEQSTARRQMVQALQITAAMTGANTTAGLSFDEAGSVEQTLASLSTQPDIIEACVYDKAGRLFAHYLRVGEKQLTTPSVRDLGYRFEGRQLKLFQPIMLAGEPIGTIYLEEDLSQLTARLQWCLFAGCVILAACAGVAFFLSAWLQKVISGPVSDLANTMSVVRKNKDYSVRASRQGNDELGRLIDGFNEMLAQIQERDANLENRVAERTRKLAESEANYYSLVDQMPAGIFRKDKDGRYVFVNSWFCRFTGAKPADFLGKLPHEVNNRSHVGHESETDKLAVTGSDHHKNILQTGQQIECDEKRTGVDGKTTHFHAVKSPVYGPDGSVVGSQGILLDITGRKLAEEALAYERDLLKAMFDHSPDSIYFKDRESRYVRISRSEMKNLFNVALGRHKASHPGDVENIPEHLKSLEKFHEYVIGLSDADIYGAEASAEFRKDEEETIRTGKSLLGKIEKVPGPDGEIRWYMTTKTPWRNAEGQTIGILGTGRNITDLKEAEAKAEEAHKKLLETSRMAGMAEVATSVLHNVGNVLNSINVSTTLAAEIVSKSRLNNLGKLAAMIQERRDDLAEFLTTDPRGIQVPGYLLKLTEHLGAEQAQLLSEIELTRKNIEHVKDIVTMQQSYAKVSGVVEKVKVTDLVEDALRMNDGALIRHNIELVRDYTNESIECHTERQKVLQILVNLIRNAKYACDDSGRMDKRLTIQVRSHGGRAQIAVIDNGVGIPAENMTRIFNHGFTTRDHGHGFGLHSGSLAARELGGTLTAHSGGRGLGARFTLDLPLQQSHDL